MVNFLFRRIAKRTGDSAEKVPLLGDMQCWKSVSKSSKDDREKVLMMFIRPTILRNPEETNALSREKFDHLITRDFKVRRMVL